MLIFKQMKELFFLKITLNITNHFTVVHPGSLLSEDFPPRAKTTTIPAITGEKLNTFVDVRLFLYSYT